MLDTIRGFVAPGYAQVREEEPAGGERWRHQSPAPPQAYHAIARGVYAGALRRQVDPAHRTLGRFFQEEIAGLTGTRILAHPETLLDAAQCADQYAVDGFMLTPIAFTQGGFARLVTTDQACTPTIGWGGAGGQMVRASSELGLACAYVTNTLGVRMAMHDPRANLLLCATLDCARRRRLPQKQDQR